MSIIGVDATIGRSEDNSFGVTTSPVLGLTMNGLVVFCNYTNKI